MRIRPHAPVNNVECRQLFFLQSEPCPDLLNVLRRGLIRKKFAQNPMDIRLWNLRRLQQIFFRRFEVASIVTGRNTPLVNAEDVDLRPIEPRGRELAEHRSRSVSSRDCKAGPPARSGGLSQQFVQIFRALQGTLGRVLSNSEVRGANGTHREAPGL